MDLRLDIELIKTPNPENEMQIDYYLKFDNLEGDEPTKIFFVSSIGQQGGMRLAGAKGRKLKKTGGQTIVAVLLYISILGHDLDQWAYVNLDTNEITLIPAE